MSAGDFETAYDYFQSSIELAPYWHIPHINMGIVYEHYQNDSLAMHYYNKAVDYEQYSGHSLDYRSRLLLKQSRFQLALNDLIASIPLNTNYYHIYKGMATAYAGLGVVDSSLKYSKICLELEYERALEDIVPISTPFWNDQNLYNKGIEYYQKLDKITPDQWWIHDNIGNLALKVDSNSLAQRSFDLAEKLQENN